MGKAYKENSRDKGTDKDGIEGSWRGIRADFISERMILEHTKYPNIKGATLLYKLSGNNIKTAFWQAIARLP